MLSAIAECGGLVSKIRAQLSKTFESDFLVWQTSITGWNLVEETPSPQWALQYHSQLVKWFELLSQQQERRPQTKSIDGQPFVAAVVQSDCGDPLIVAGRLQVDSLKLAACAAELVLGKTEHSAEADMQQMLVEQYAERLTDSYEELTFLRRLSRHVDYCAADRSLADAAKSILPQLCELTELEGIFLVGAVVDDENAEHSQVIGHSGSMLDADCILDLVEEARHSNRQVLVRNYEGELAGDSSSPRHGVRSIAVVPIEKDGTLYGWLVGFNKRRSPVPVTSMCADEIGSIEASLLEAAALMLGSHAANNRLFREKETLVVEVIHTLVGVIEAKDIYTCGHSDRVALTARRLGEELGFSEEECQDLFLSGLLHDIGKIGVADDILLKPGKLTDEEFFQIKLHPERGARLIRGLKPLQRLVPGILHHHEAIDGSGYPHGLVGNGIPIMARVLAVADAFDAMTSNRPYRLGMPISKAEEILRKGAGTQWDATVVDAYFAARNEIVDIGLQWQDHLRRLLDWRADASGKAEHLAPNWIGEHQMNPMHGGLT